MIKRLSCFFFVFVFVFGIFCCSFSASSSTSIDDDTIIHIFSSLIRLCTYFPYSFSSEFIYLIDFSSRFWNFFLSDPSLFFDFIVSFRSLSVSRVDLITSSVFIPFSLFYDFFDFSITYMHVTAFNDVFISSLTGSELSSAGFNLIFPSGSSDILFDSVSDLYSFPVAPSSDFSSFLFSFGNLFTFIFSAISQFFASLFIPGNEIFLFLFLLPFLSFVVWLLFSFLRF